MAMTIWTTMTMTMTMVEVQYRRRRQWWWRWCNPPVQAGCRSHCRKWTPECLSGCLARICVWSVWSRLSIVIFYELDGSDAGDCDGCSCLRCGCWSALWHSCWSARSGWSALWRNSYSALWRSCWSALRSCTCSEWGRSRCQLCHTRGWRPSTCTCSLVWITEHYGFHDSINMLSSSNVPSNWVSIRSSCSFVGEEGVVWRMKMSQLPSFKNCIRVRKRSNQKMVETRFSHADSELFMLNMDEKNGTLS